MPIEFNNESEQRQQAFYNQNQTTNSEKGMTHWLVKKGIASTPQQANIYLIVLALVFLFISGYMFIGTLNPPSQPYVELNPEHYVPGSN